MSEFKFLIWAEWEPKSTFLAIIPPKLWPTKIIGFLMSRLADSYYFCVRYTYRSRTVNIFLGAKLFAQRHSKVFEVNDLSG